MSVEKTFKDLIEEGWAFEMATKGRREQKWHEKSLKADIEVGIGGDALKQIYQN